VTSILICAPPGADEKPRDRAFGLNGMFGHARGRNARVQALDNRFIAASMAANASARECVG
jgi:hypothetical protein